MQQSLKTYFVCLITILFSVISFSQKNQEKQLKQLLKTEKNSSKQFMRMIALGEYYKQHDIHRADSLKSVILKKSENLSDTYKFKALLYLAQIAEIQGDHDEYFRTVTAFFPYLEKKISKENEYYVYHHLGHYYNNSLDLKKAKYYFNYSLRLAKKSRNYEEIAASYSSLAYNYTLANNKDSAYYYTDEAIKYARRSTNKSILAESFNTQANIYANFGQVELSVAKNYFSLQLVSGINDLPRMARFTREIGEAQLFISNYVEAEKYFRQSINYSKQIKDYRQVALGYSNLGTVFAKRTEYSIAIDFNLKAIAILTKLNDHNGLGKAYNNLGVIYREEHQYNLAAHNFNRSLVNYESTNNREQIASVYHNVGMVFQQQKRYSIALNYLNRSIEIRKQFGSKNQIFHTYRIMADVYSDIGKIKESLKYMHLYLDYTDSNSSVQESAKIAELGELYRSEQRERLIQLQADSIERQHRERAWTSTKLENT